MCVIVHKPEDVLFAEEDIKNCYERNPAGFGVMYYDTVKKRVIAKKKLLKDIDVIQEIFKELKGKESCYHFRITTHGPTNDLMSHPFEVFSKDNGDPVDMYLMHNGVITKAKPSSDESDTADFADRIMKKALKGRPEEIESEWFKSMVEDYIGTGSKLCIMYGDGKVIKFNEKMGDEYKGVWVSNKCFVNHTNYNTTHNKSRSWEKNRGKQDIDDEDMALWEGFCSGYTPRPTQTNNVVSMGPSEVELRGAKVKKGDKVHIYAENDPNFYSSGVITSIVGQVLWVDYVTMHGGKSMSSFNALTGKNDYHIQRKLQVFPNLIAGEQLPLSFEEAEKRLKDSQLPVVITKEPEPEVDPNEVHYQDGTLYNMNFDSKAYRWGGGFMDSMSSTEYGGELVGEGLQAYRRPKSTTILDIYNMTAQQRLNFFMKYREVAFSIFSDLIEFITLEDETVEWDDVAEENQTEDNPKGASMK